MLLELTKHFTSTLHSVSGLKYMVSKIKNTRKLLFFQNFFPKNHEVDFSEVFQQKRSLGFCTFLIETWYRFLFWVLIICQIRHMFKSLLKKNSTIMAVSQSSKPQKQLEQEPENEKEKMHLKLKSVHIFLKFFTSESCIT